MSRPINNPDLIAAAEDFCLAETVDGLVCTKCPNHDGWHRVDLDGKLLDTWPADA